MKDKSKAEIDLSSMTKEELIAYIQKRSESFEAQIQELKNSNQQKEKENAKQTAVIVTNLRAELSNRNAQLEEALEYKKKLEDRVKDLELFKRNSSDMIRNILDNISNYYFVFKSLDSPEQIPEFDERNMLELNMFLEEKISTLLNIGQTFLEHQRKALNLPRSEKTHGGSRESADKIAQEDGEQELANSVSVVQEDNDISDYEEASSECSVTANCDTDSSVSSVSSVSSEDACQSYCDNTLNQEDVKKVILSGCSRENRQSIEHNLSEGTKILLSNRKNDTTSVNDSNRRRSYKHFISVNDSSQVAAVMTNNLSTHFHMYCQNCRKVTEFILNARAKRIKSVISPTDSLQSVRTVLSKIQSGTCSICGRDAELNPVFYTDFTVTTDKTDRRYAVDEQEKNAKEVAQNALTELFSSVSDKDQNEIPNDDKRAMNVLNNRIRQKARKDIYNSIKKSDVASEKKFSLTDALIDVGDGYQPVINPLSFDAGTFGMTPAFSKSAMSVSLLCTSGAYFTQFGAPKNRIFNFYEGNGLPFTKEQVTGGINAFARAYLHNVARTIHDDILSNSVAVVCDESTLLCRENANKKLSHGGSRKSQIWVMTSSFTSPVKAAWYTVSRSRTAGNVVDILLDGVNNDNRGTLQYVISDGYAGYDSGISSLEKITGIKLKSCRCWTHARRGLFKLLQSMDLIRVYENELLPKGESFFNFEKNLKKYRASEAGRNMSDNNAQLLTIFYLINALFVIDSEVIRTHKFICDSEDFKKDLDQARKQKSSLIVNLIFDSIRMYIARNPKVITVEKKKNSEYRFVRNRAYPESGALIYLLKFETPLKEFTQSPDIELSSSAAERALKLGICTRHSCMFLQSKDGAAAFADYQTVVNTCNLNRVPVQPYLVWLCANIRLRLIKKMNAGDGDSSYFTMPHKKSIKDENNKVIGHIDMYDKKNKLCYDQIDTKGLTPYDYRRYLCAAEYLSQDLSS